MAWSVDDPVGMKPPPPREIPATRTLPSTSSGGHGLARQVCRHGHAQAEEVAAAEGFADLFAIVEKHQLDLLHAPARGGDGRDVEALVDLRPARVVDAGDDFRHVVVLERHARGDDVRVVPARDGDERIRVLDAGVLQHVPVETESDDLPRTVPGWVGVEGLWILVDDRDVVVLDERVRQLRAHATATHDDHAHTVRKSTRRPEPIPKVMRCGRRQLAGEPRALNRSGGPSGRKSRERVRARGGRARMMRTDPEVRQLEGVIGPPDLTRRMGSSVAHLQERGVREA